MKQISIILIGAVLLCAIAAYAGGQPVCVSSDGGVLHGRAPDAPATAARDTIRLIGPWGSGATVNGQFETPDGGASWNGWTHIDRTQPFESAWHVDTYNVVAGQYSAWCGDISYPSCSELDPEGGYGPDYDERLSWTAAVVDPGLPATVTVTATVNHDTEPGYDFSNLGYCKAGSDYINYLWTADGAGDQVPVSGAVTYQPGEYVGENEDQVKITWHVTSDGGWDDHDCSYYGDGALQIDEVSVTLVNGEDESTYFHDFEDGTLGEWFTDFPQGVGDYAHLRSQLDDIDPCAQNPTPVACFIADEIMLAERGLPTEMCETWCYGPGGYIVTTHGGLAAPDGHIHNAVESPIIPWPAGDYAGASFLFDVYQHEDLSFDSPLIFWFWGIRSTASSDPEDIRDEPFRNRNFLYYGLPEWKRGGDVAVGDLIEPGCRYVQVSLEVYHYQPWVWGGYNHDGYPAPYYDNVSLVCYDHYGPALAARTVDLAQDAFPADGGIHTGAEAHLNHVRFDMARNVSPAVDLRNDPGDSLALDIVAVRTGALLVETDIDPLVGAPRLHWTLRPGPAVDPAWRTNLAAAGSDGVPDANGCLSGSVAGAPAMRFGWPVAGRWAFDLPDSNFLYPGDVLHYFFAAWDDLDGDYQVAMLPADRSGFGDFDDPLAYDPSFTFRALPALQDADGAQPGILFWNDFGNGGGRDEWHGALGNLGFVAGVDYDEYYTNGPSSGVGNGLGGRATAAQIGGYATILYTCGDLGTYTITNLDYEHDPGDDIGVIANWLAAGGRYLFATGDNLVNDLERSGAETAAFVAHEMGLLWIDDDARSLLGGDIAPTVFPVPDNTVFVETDAWCAYGGCPDINTFDAVAAAGAEVLAVFNDGVSGLAAAAKHVGIEGSTVVTLPYDFTSISEAVTAKAGQPAPLPARARVLSEILYDAGLTGSGPPVAAEVPAAGFAVRAYPNPFNPTARIEWQLPAANRVAVKIYDLRGQLVRTLLDEPRDAGPGHVLWDGTDDAGRGVASGAYFYEVRGGGEAKTAKIMMLK